MLSQELRICALARDSIYLLNEHCDLYVRRVNGLRDELLVYWGCFCWMSIATLTRPDDGGRGFGAKTMRSCYGRCQRQFKVCRGVPVFHKSSQQRAAAQWRSYSGAQWGTGPTISFCGPTIRISTYHVNYYQFAHN